MASRISRQAVMNAQRHKQENQDSADMQHHFSRQTVYSPNHHTRFHGHQSIAYVGDGLPISRRTMSSDWSDVIPYRDGGTSHLGASYKPTKSSQKSETTTTSNDNEDEAISIPQARGLLNVPMPVASSNIAPYAYHKALHNRIEDWKLQPNAVYDLDAHKPIFVHDSLMCPGSLANLLEKPSLRLESSMTAALLPGFSARVHADTMQPRLVPAQDSREYVQGMVIFGLERDDRRLIRRHYRDRTDAKRERVFIEVEVVTSGAGLQGPQLHPQRRQIRAYAWVWKDRKKGEAMKELLPTRVKWSLEDYLAGNLGQKQTIIRVEANAKGDEEEDGYIGRDIVERELKPAKREEVTGGPGGLEWERAHTFSGW